MPAARPSLTRSAPAQTDVSTTRVTKIAKRISGQSKKSLKLSDHKGTLEHILKATENHFRCKIFTCDAFPDSEVELQLVTTVWAKHCEHSDADFQLEDHTLHITARASECCGHVKEFIRPVVIAGFGLEHSDQQHSPGPQAQRDGRGCNGRYGVHLQGRLCRLPRETRHQDGVAAGVKYPQYLSAMALIITLIEHTVNEYSAGHRNSVPFTQTGCEGYQYRRHLQD
ncbi:hypothetical protein EIP91_007051 [Steccherinum ochraceum]|uniref:DUF6532 domain-containing protein n=1 Tax=Steccherinum ochraceum TaxID=92696 RepID=A0A4R0R4W4_9APHY|nr:hypothetical protein EIP91_007051 [Steccherinum ochraceum]